MIVSISKDVLLNSIPKIVNRIVNNTIALEKSKKAIPDLKTFVYKYFGHYITSEFGFVQDKLIASVELLQDRHLRTNAIRQSIAAPRGFAKSSIVTLFGILWLVLKRDHRFVVILSSSKRTAQGFLQSIIDEIEQNELLLNDFPELAPAKDFKNQTVAWRDSEIVFNNGVRIMALGWLNSVRGLRKKSARPDLIIADDPDEEKDVESTTRMLRKYRWFERAVLRLGGIKPVDVFVCYTTISNNCVGEYIYNDKLKFGDWIKQKYKAIEVVDGKEVSTWQSAFPIEILQKEREEDPLGFATEKQNEPLPEIEQIFKGLIHTYTYPPSSLDGTKCLAVDLSIGKTETSDYSAIVGTLMTTEGKFLEIYNSIERRPPSKIVIDIIEALKIIKWDLCGIEINANQEHFLDLFKGELAKVNQTLETKIITPIVGISNTGDKIKRISTLQILVKSQWLLLRDDSALLYKQLDNFPHDKKDGADALEMSVSLHKECNKGKIIFTKSNQEKTLDAEMIRQQRINNLRNRNYG